MVVKPEDLANLKAFYENAMRGWQDIVGGNTEVCVEGDFDLLIHCCQVNIQRFERELGANVCLPSPSPFSEKAGYSHGRQLAEDALQNLRHPSNVTA